MNKNNNFIKMLPLSLLILNSSLSNLVGKEEGLLQYYDNKVQKPLPPSDSRRAFVVPDGMNIRLLASEPLISEPSDICWDEYGRLFVSELHGYNLEGQYEVDKLNEAGIVDTQVRRVQASEESKRRGEENSYGVIKMLFDDDNDGLMDRSILWADDLPPCYGIVPANGGIIAACTPEVVFLKDTDHDNIPDVREVLFSGFGTGMLERGINYPRWGVDDWIYFGAGWPNSEISGKYLNENISLTRTDFRIQPDGSALEAVTGRTFTTGMALTGGGYKFVANTTHPGVLVSPILWRYILRNPYSAAPNLFEPASSYTQVYGISKTHPWRIRREQNLEYFSLYRKYGVSDSVASGYFTSTCGPLVYKSKTLPKLSGDYLVCEPAANIIHRAEIYKEGTELKLRRKSGEERKEFLASSDAWFRPIALKETPDGNLAIIDYYREIIEDYSAVPRHLQQEYGLMGGSDMGRIWILEPEDLVNKSHPKSQYMAALSNKNLVGELSDVNYWRRRTAQRMLYERNALPEGFYFSRWKNKADSDGQIIALQKADEEQFSSPQAKEIEKDILNLEFGENPDSHVILQATLSLGESKSRKVTDALIKLARVYGNLKWMDYAVGSSSRGQEIKIFTELVQDQGKGMPVLVNLAGIISARGLKKEIMDCLNQIASSNECGRVEEILKLGLDQDKEVAGGGNSTVIMPELPNAEQRKVIDEKAIVVNGALENVGNIEQGKLYFTAFCSACHYAKGIGAHVGPDLDAEYQRAPEAIANDILSPSEVISPGYETVLVTTKQGFQYVGVVASESPNSITIKLPGGSEKTFLMAGITVSTRSQVSLMPLELGQTLQPGQINDIISFLRHLPERVR